MLRLSQEVEYMKAKKGKSKVEENTLKTKSAIYNRLKVSILTDVLDRYALGAFEAPTEEDIMSGAFIGFERRVHKIVDLKENFEGCIVCLQSVLDDNQIELKYTDVKHAAFEVDVTTFFRDYSIMPIADEIMYRHKVANPDRYSLFI